MTTEPLFSTVMNRTTSDWDGANSFPDDPPQPAAVSWFGAAESSGVYASGGESLGDDLPRWIPAAVELNRISRGACRGPEPAFFYQIEQQSSGRLDERLVKNDPMSCNLLCPGVDG